MLVVLFVSCSSNSPNEVQKRFLLKKVSDKFSGIDFVNQIHEDPSHNIINYIYFYNGGGVALGDIDNDGLTDIKEADIGTDPLKRDSDGDGWSDKTEYEEGSDPLTAASQPKLPSGLPIWLLFEASNSSIERLQQ